MVIPMVVVVSSVVIIIVVVVLVSSSQDFARTPPNDGLLIIVIVVVVVLPVARAITTGRGARVGWWWECTVNVLVTRLVGDNVQLLLLLVNGRQWRWIGDQLLDVHKVLAQRNVHGSFSLLKGKNQSYSKQATCIHCTNLVDDGRIATTFQQHLGQLFPVHGGGDVQCSIIILVQHVHVGKGGDEYASHTNMAVPAGTVQCRIAKVVLLIRFTP